MMTFTSTERSDGVAVDVQMAVELSQDNPQAPFEATLIRQETTPWPGSTAVRSR